MPRAWDSGEEEGQQTKSSARRVVVPWSDRFSFPFGLIWDRLDNITTL